MTVPAWKLALLEKKHKREVEERKRQDEEEAKMEIIPAWKRDLLLRKRSAAPVNSWRVTPKVANVSMTQDQSNRTVQNSSAGNAGVVGNNSTVVDYAPAQEKHSTTEAPKDDGVSEEHCHSVHDNPFLRQERKRLNSGGGDGSTLTNRNRPETLKNEVISVNWKPTISTKTANNANNNTIQHTNDSSTAVRNNNSSLNKPHRPEVIIIPKHKPEQSRVISPKQPQSHVVISAKQPQKVPIGRRRSLSPSPKETRQFTFSTTPVPEPVNATTPTSPDDDQYQSGRVNKLLGLFGKAASQDDLLGPRIRQNSWERNHVIAKPSASISLVNKETKPTINRDKTGRPPLPPSSAPPHKEVTVVNAAPVQVKTFAPTKTDAPKPPQIQPYSQTKVDAPSLTQTKTFVPTRFDTPTPAQSKPFVVTKADAPKQPVVIRNVTEEKTKATVPLKQDEDDFEPAPIPKPRRQKKKIDASLIIKLEGEEPPNYAGLRSRSLANRQANMQDKEESLNIRPIIFEKVDIPDPNTSHFVAEENELENVAVPASNKRRAPPPPMPSTLSTQQPSQNTSANITIVTKESTAPPPKIAWNGTENNEMSIPSNANDATAKSELSGIGKQTIIMTPVDKKIETDKQLESTVSKSEVRQAVEELKAEGTTFRITPKIHRYTAKPAPAPVAPTEIETKKSTHILAAKEQNHIALEKSERDDDIPVSNIDDLLTPPSSPEKTTVSFTKVETSNKNVKTKPVQNGEITIDANTGKINNTVTMKDVAPVVEVVKTPLRRLAGGKIRKITNYKFAGENAVTGKPSMLVKSKPNKLSISFNDSATVKHVYPSEESLLEDDDSDEYDGDNIMMFDEIKPAPEPDKSDNVTSKTPLKSNTILHSSGGFQNYTPSHLQDAYMNTIERRSVVVEEKPQPVEEKIESNHLDAAKPLEDNDADYFSTSSSSALLF